jgi:glycerophosphoryl diester phosphodiesterase
MTESEQNTEAAFRRALENGFGIETDFRDCGGSLVVSHDPALSGSPPVKLTADDFFAVCPPPPHSINTAFLP